MQHPRLCRLKTTECGNNQRHVVFARRHRVGYHRRGVPRHRHAPGWIGDAEAGVGANCIGQAAQLNPFEAFRFLPLELERPACWKEDFGRIVCLRVTYHQPVLCILVAAGPAGLGRRKECQGGERNRLRDIDRDRIAILCKPEHVTATQRESDGFEIRPVAALQHGETVLQPSPRRGEGPHRAFALPLNQHLCCHPYVDAAFDLVADGYARDCPTSEGAGDILKCI